MFRVHNKIDELDRTSFFSKTEAKNDLPSLLKFSEVAFEETPPRERQSSRNQIKNVWNTDRSQHKCRVCCRNIFVRGRSICLISVKVFGANFNQCLFLRLMPSKQSTTRCIIWASPCSKSKMWMHKSCFRIYLRLNTTRNRYAVNAKERPNI